MAQRVLASIVIIAMLLVMQIPLPVIIFFAALTYFIWRAVQRSDHNEVGHVFEFYIAANEILHDENRRWFGFEIAEVVESGERLLCEMPDAPPLVHFALGALYQRAGDPGPAAEHLAYLLENERGDESKRFAPSPELRRYTSILRKIEHEPSTAPQTVAALRNLERARQEHAALLLEQSRAQISLAAAAEAERPAVSKQSSAENNMPQNLVALGWGQTALAPPAPISEVLRHIYEEENTA